MHLITPVIIFGAKIRSLLADNAATIAATGISIAQDLSDETLQFSDDNGTSLYASFFDEHHDLRTLEKITRLTNDLIAASFYESRIKLLTRSQVARRLGLLDEELGKRHAVGRKCQESLARDFTLDAKLITALTGGGVGSCPSIKKQMELMGEFMRTVPWIAEFPSYSHLREIFTRLGNDQAGLRLMLSNPSIGELGANEPDGKRLSDLSVKELGSTLTKYRNAVVKAQEVDDEKQDGEDGQDPPSDSDSQVGKTATESVDHDSTIIDGLTQLKEIRTKVRGLAREIFTHLRRLRRLQKRLCSRDPDMAPRMLQERKRMHEVILQILNLQMLDLEETNEQFGPYEDSNQLWLQEFNIREEEAK